MAMLHVVDPANEPDGDKLHKINPLLEFFKGRCKDLYQPRQNVAVDERIVSQKFLLSLFFCIEIFILHVDLLFTKKLLLFLFLCMQIFNRFFSLS